MFLHGRTLVQLMMVPSSEKSVLLLLLLLYVLRESTKHPKLQNSYNLTLAILKKKPFILQVPPVGQYWESVSAP